MTDFNIEQVNRLRDAGRAADAEALCRLRLRERPDVETMLALADLLAESGRIDDAIAMCRDAIAADSNNAAAHQALAHGLVAKGDHAGAADEFLAAATITPTAQVLNNLGAVLLISKRFAEAVEPLQRAVEIQPDSVEMQFNLASAYWGIDRYDLAMKPMREVLRLAPDRAGAWAEAAKTATRSGHFREAADFMQRAVDLEPSRALWHANLGMALLQLGEFQRGWDEFEWRRRVDAPDSALPRHVFAQPQWVGQAVEGKTVFVYSEQGFGDTIMFARYLPLLRDRGASVILSCPPALKRLMQLMNFGSAVSVGDSVARIDFHCPMMSIARGFGMSSVSDIPSNVPYVAEDANDVEHWGQRLADDRKLKVGIAWAGRPEHALDKYRSMPFSQIERLVRGASDATFYSLQPGPAGAGAAAAGIIDHTSELRDFAETAALIQNLDLVIAVDTAVAHLAGAMAKPVWTMLWFGGDFRWLTDRDDSPWYPTMRLFRQKTSYDWDEVIDRVASKLPKFLSEHAR